MYIRRRRVSTEAKNPEITIHELANLQQRRIQLHKRIRLFREIQQVYTPAVAHKIAASRRMDEQPEDVTLWMPSQLDDVSRVNGGCYLGLADMESKLRKAQCLDCLDSIRMILRGRASMIKFRTTNLTGQKQNTRFNVAMDRLQAKMKALMVKYNAARQALVGLDPGGEWESQLQVLRAGDLRMVGKHGDIVNDPSQDPIASSTKKTKTTHLATVAAPYVGEGTKTTSWIWTVAGALGDGEDEQLNEGMLHIATLEQVFTDDNHHHSLARGVGKGARTSAALDGGGFVAQGRDAADHRYARVEGSLVGGAEYCVVGTRSRGCRRCACICSGAGCSAA